MDPELQTVRVTPRWPAAGEDFRAGWEALEHLDELLCLLALPNASGPPATVRDAVVKSLEEILNAATADVVALVLYDAPPGRGRVVALFRRHLEGIVVQELPDVPLAGGRVAESVIACSGLLPGAEVAVEARLDNPPDSAGAGSFVALYSEAGTRPAAGRDVLEQVAWVFAIALRGGWPGEDSETWRSPASSEEESWCRGATRRLHPDFQEEEATGSASPEASPAEVSSHERRVVDDNVQFTVYRPRRIPPETWRPVLAFAHLAERRADAPADAPDPIAEVRRQAHQVLGDEADAYADVTQDSGEAIPREGEITFALDLPGVSVNPSQRSFRWVEDVQREEFHVRAPAALDGRTVRGALRVHLGALLVAEVRLAIQVDSAAGRTTPADTDAEHARPYRRIFPSYSHRDEEIVRQVEAYARTMGDEYLRDVTHLRAGEVWNDRLLEFIRTADVFQLFWSRNSMGSPWVRQEWEYALSLGRPHFVRPTYWETPLPEAPDRDLPPASLRALHFQRLPVRDDSPSPEAVTPAAPAASPRSAPPPAPGVDVAAQSGSADAVRAPGRPRRRLPTALMALLFIGIVGGSSFWTLWGSGAPQPPPSTVASLEALSPDGTVLASMDAEGRIRIASRVGGGPVVIATKLRPPDVAAMRFSPDGSRLICDLRNGTTVEWDTRTGTRVASVSADSARRARG